MNKHVNLSLLTDADAAAVRANSQLTDYFSTCVRKLHTSNRVPPVLMVSPNWKPAPKLSLLGPPTGFVLGVDPTNTPIMADVFHPDRYGFGCTALQLNPKDLESCEALTTAMKQLHFRPGVSGPSCEMLERFDAQLAGSSELGSAMKLSGGDGVFCGMYMSRERRDKHIYRVFLVAQGGNIEASNELFATLEDGDIEECGPKAAMRWVDAFGSVEAPGVAAESAAFDLRCKIITHMARALGIDGTIQRRIENSTGIVDTRTHVVRPCKSADGRSLLAYYSDMVPVSPKMSRLIVPESPSLGLTMLSFESTRWKPPATSLESIPYGTAGKLRTGEDFSRFWRAVQMPPQVAQMEMLCMSLRQGVNA
jgi:hypothetical protein